VVMINLRRIQAMFRLLILGPRRHEDERMREQARASTEALAQEATEVMREVQQVGRSHDPIGELTRNIKRARGNT
jgi:hypothetical protein